MGQGEAGRGGSAASSPHGPAHPHSPSRLFLLSPSAVRRQLASPVLSQGAPGSKEGGGRKGPLSFLFGDRLTTRSGEHGDRQDIGLGSEAQPLPLVPSVALPIRPGGRGLLWMSRAGYKEMSLLGGGRGGNWGSQRWTSSLSPSPGSFRPGLLQDLRKVLFPRN